ncbi:choline/Carnitine O-acyltransferase [Plectosphaerella plurivora]|uniref:Choline/Carnitine O-acyltransferase n=1 Tax=Plectosphaerella plurivora TaxID=936078 RepID=A0A9P9AFC7_9PEZI|nr:choline/Carnitine O-acyltransferase [Plectosphaerella plurivora]
MPTQVRIFSRPKSLGETLAQSRSAHAQQQPSTVPRSVPETSADDDSHHNDRTRQSAEKAPAVRHHMSNGRPINAQGTPPSGANGIATKTNGSASGPTYGTGRAVPDMALYTEKPREGGVTFSHQQELPQLPIPDLEETTRKYLTALKSLQSPREHNETRIAVQEFLQQDGPELQEKLRRYAEGKTSYIEQFWYDSYLNFDNPVVLNLNPFFLLEDDPTPARNNQVTRAASLVVSALEFVRAVRREELPPDKIKGTPLCMYQFSRLFGTARVPTENGCQIVQDPDSKHVVVMCHGQFYWFDVLDDNSDVIMTEKDISINLQTIIDDAAQTSIQDAAKGALGVLSTENRKIWSGLREVLTREPGSNNADSLAIVDSALFVLCLDYTEAADVDALCGNMLCGTHQVERGVQIGTCTNRWYDKLQIIVCKNGSAGINFEHTGVDGHTVLRFASDVYTDTILRFARTINGQAPTLWATTSPDPSRRDPASFGDVHTTPHKLEWDMVPELNIAVRFAETRLADLIEQNEFRTLDFKHYGKNFITSTGFSPDAFVQMAFQAAYYGLYGRVECTYEPAMTKTFLHGRTEAIRSVTDESVNFVQTFWGDNPAEQKVEALRQACKRHVANTKECAKAEGCDRHLYALFCVWQKTVDDELATSTNGYSSSTDGYSERDASSVVGSPGRDSVLSADNTNNIDGGVSVTSSSGGRHRGDSTNSRTNREAHPLPLIFADPGWDKLNNTILSTSNCGNPSLRHFGFGPTSGSGFGIGYIIKDEGINICISSKHRQTKRFVDTLESYLLEVRRILRITTRRNTGPDGVAVGGAKQTRARELEDSHHHIAAERPKAALAQRMKSRGRMITGLEPVKPSFMARSSTGTMSPTEDSVMMSDDELGGYGFFDAGMLLQALKARNENLMDTGETKPSERAAVQARRRDVGKKLRLSDY